MSNILKLIRLGFLPPKFEEEDLKKTIYYKIWESFRTVCYYAEITKLSPPPEITCKKLKTRCNFNSCPIISEAISKYEKDVYGI